MDRVEENAIGAEGRRRRFFRLRRIRVSTNVVAGVGDPGNLRRECIHAAGITDPGYSAKERMPA